MRFFRKVFKIVGYTVVIITIVFIVLIHQVFKFKSNETITEFFEEANQEVLIEQKEFEGFSYRFIAMQKEVDTTLLNLIFIHGSPGSVMDYKRYLADKQLNVKANIFAYERIGYGTETAPDVQKLSFEIRMLDDITKNFDNSKTILFGYSYGGPIALGSKKEYKKVVLCAPAVYSEVEPMFWFLNFYKFPLTRIFIPKALKAASVEKLQHPDDLKQFENNWNSNPAQIKVIHGNKDWIVPFSNTEFLIEQFPNDQIEVVVLEEAGHDLIWSRFNEIKSELLDVIDE